MRRRRALLDSASYKIGQFVQPGGTGPGEMVGRGRETLPVGSGQSAGTVPGGVADQGAGDSRIVPFSDAGVPVE